MAGPGKFMDFVDGIRGLLRGPAVRTADDYDTLARQYAGALLSGDEAEAARLAQVLGTAKVRGEFALPNESDLAAMAESFPADRNILGGPLKTRGQSAALSRRADVGGLVPNEDMTLEDVIALQQAMDQGAIIRGTLNTPEMAMGNPQDDLMAFFGNKTERKRAGLDPDLTPTRGDMAGQRVIEDLQADQLLGIAAARAADEAAELDAMAEIAPLYTMRSDSRVGLPPMPKLTKKDLLKIGGAGAGAAGLAYALSQMGGDDEDEALASQLIVDADMQPEQAGDPTGLAAAAEEEAMVDELEDAIADIGEGDPIGSEVPPGETMGADYLRELMAGFDDKPSDTADLVAESRPIPASTPVVVSQRTVYQKPRRSYRRTSRGRRRPNYAYSRAMNPSQRGRRR